MWGGADLHALPAEEQGSEEARQAAADDQHVLLCGRWENIGKNSLACVTVEQEAMRRKGSRSSPIGTSWPSTYGNSCLARREEAGCGRVEVARFDGNKVALPHELCGKLLAKAHAPRMASKGVRCAHETASRGPAPAGHARDAIGRGPLSSPWGPGVPRWDVRVSLSSIGEAKAGYMRRCGVWRAGLDSWAGLWRANVAGQ